MSNFTNSELCIQEIIISSESWVEIENGNSKSDKID